MRALGEAHLKCCMQMYHAKALLMRGSVRTLIRSVEETNGAGGMATDAQSIRGRHSKLTICLDAEYHDACETLV